MKRTVFLMLCASLCISFMATSCEKEEPASSYRECSEYLLFKFNGDYEQYIPVGYSNKKNKVVAYPSPSNPFASGLIYGSEKCSNDYFLDQSVLADPRKWNNNNTIVYTDISVDEYKEIWDINTIDIRDTLTSRIIDKDPYKEIYLFPRTDTILCQGKYQEPNFDKINEMIESGEFFTYEGVERIK